LKKIVKKYQRVEKLRKSQNIPSERKIVQKTKISKKTEKTKNNTIGTIQKLRNWNPHEFKEKDYDR